MDIIFEDSLMLYQNFFSPQVKQSVVISNKHGIYKFSHDFPNGLRLRNYLHGIIAAGGGLSANTRKKNKTKKRLRN